MTFSSNQTIFAVETPANVTTSPSNFQLNCARRFRDMNLLGFLIFLVVFSFCQGVKVVINANALSDCLEIWYAERRHTIPNLVAVP